MKLVSDKKKFISNTLYPGDYSSWSVDHGMGNLKLIIQLNTHLLTSYQLLLLNILRVKFQ